MKEENKFILTFKKHWSKFFLGLFMLICIAFWAERLHKSQKQQGKQDFFNVNKIFEEFQKEHSLSQDAFDSVEGILERHPELHAKFDGLLALSCFSQANETKGLEYAQSLLKQVESRLPSFYLQYGQCTLLIAEAHYSQAYQEALSLHAQLHGQTDYQILDALNTLRLIFLAECMEQTEQKNLFWIELQTHPVFATLNSLFKKGNCTLESYFQKMLK